MPPRSATVFISCRMPPLLPLTPLASSGTGNRSDELRSAA